MSHPIVNSISALNTDCQVIRTYTCVLSELVDAWRREGGQPESRSGVGLPKEQPFDKSEISEKNLKVR